MNNLDDLSAYQWPRQTTEENLADIARMLGVN